MNLEDLLSNPQVLNQLAQGMGIGSDEARTGLGALLPAVTRGLQRNSSGGGGLDALIGALQSGGHQRYVDSPDLLAKPDAQLDGNAILGHVFGSKDVSRNVAAAAAADTGLDTGMLKKLLPLVASLAMGALSKSSQGGASLRSSGGQGTDLLGSVLGSLLGGGGGGRSSENDSPLDDILDLAKKFL